MGCCWPCFGPCLYGKISARVSWPTTKLEALGDTPFKQWFRISVRLLATKRHDSLDGACIFLSANAREDGVEYATACRGVAARLTVFVPPLYVPGLTLLKHALQLILILVYWFASWGESMMAPDEPHFSAIANSEAEINGIKSAHDMMETKIVDAVAKIDKNITLAEEIVGLDQNITHTVEGDEAIVAKTINDDASEMWLGSKEDLDDLSKVADFPEIKEAMPEPAVSPAQQVFATLKWVVSTVWLVLVVVLRAHTRKRFDIAPKICGCKMCGDVYCEDVCCSICCTSCTLSQMATHSGAGKILCSDDLCQTDVRNQLIEQHIYILQ